MHTARFSADSREAREEGVAPIEGLSAELGALKGIGTLRAG